MCRAEADHHGREKRGQRVERGPERESLALAVDESRDERGGQPAERIEQVGVEGEQAEWTFGEGFEVGHGEQDAPARDERHQRVKDEIVESLPIDLVAGGAFLGKRQPDPQGARQQDDVARRGEEIAEEFDHVI